MTIAAVPPVISRSPVSADPAHGKPATRLGNALASMSNNHVKTQVLAVLGNEKARIALAALRGDTEKLKALHATAAEKLETATAKRDTKRENVRKAADSEKKLGRYDRGTPLQYGSQKSHNDNVSRHEGALQELRLAQHRLAAQEKLVDRYSGRVALAFQSLKNLSGPQTATA